MRKMKQGDITQWQTFNHLFQQWSLSESSTSGTVRANSIVMGACIVNNATQSSSNTNTKRVQTELHTHTHKHTHSHMHAHMHTHTCTHNINTHTFTIVKIFHHILCCLKSLSIGDNALSIITAGWSGFSTGLNISGNRGVFSAIKIILLPVSQHSNDSM